MTGKRIARPGPVTMTGEELKVWRATEGLTQQQAAHRFNTSLRGYQQWEADESTIPGPVPLACMAISFGLRWTKGLFIKRTEEA